MNGALLVLLLVALPIAVIAAYAAGPDDPENRPFDWERDL